MAAISRTISRTTSLFTRTPAMTRSFATGTVKWFNISRGYGFITPDDESAAEVFVHQSAVQSTGFRFLREGERIAFDLVDTDRGVQAANVTGPEGQQLNRAREHDDKFDLSKLE